MRTILPLLLIPFFVVNCGSSKSPDSSSVRKFDNKKDAQEAFESSIISCATGDCLEFAGGLYTFTDDLISYSLSSCSATLISQDRVITNRHCIPEDISYKGADCAERIKIHFPGTLALPAEKHECSSIELISAKEATAGPDWAILKLKKISMRQPVNLSRGGVPEDSIVNISKVNFDLHIDQPSRGEIVKTKCIANSNHILANHFIGSQSVLVNVNDCDQSVIKGNSGSGILNDQNELIGVLSFANSISFEGAEDLKVKYPTLKQNSGGGTNLACIEFDGFKAEKLCEYNSKEYLTLAKTYSLFKAQKSDKSFVSEESEKLKKDKYEFIEMTSQIDSQTLERFDFKNRRQRAMPNLKNYLGVEALQSIFFEFPKCVKEGAAKSFNIKMKVRQIKGQFKEEEQFFQTLESQLEEITVKVSSSDSTNYTLSFPEVLMGVISVIVFDMPEFSNVKYNIGKCE